MTRRLQRLLWLSAVALFFERLWPRLWPLAAILGTFVALALTDLLPRLPVVWHVTVLAIFALAMVAAAAHAWPGVRPIDREAARRRLDRDAQRGHRPLAASEDRLAAGTSDPLSAALWERHQQQMTAAAAGLRVRWPAPDIARHEPWGIRAFVILLLVIGAAAAGNDWQPRLLRAVSPDLFAMGEPVTVELWITPPAYTRRPPLFLRAGKGEDEAATSRSPVAVPVAAGSRLQSRVTGTSAPPRLQLGETEVPFVALAGDADAPPSHRVETVIEHGDRLAVRSGYRELASWPLQVIADAAPMVSFLEAPAAKGNGLLGLSYQATDDYGISDITAIIRPEAGDGELRLPLALTEPGAPVVAGHDLKDLAAHPWAGKPVMIHLEARDGTGQIGRSAPLAVTLPLRTFSHPVAKAIVAERTRLGEDASEASRRRSAVTLGTIAAEQDAYAGDPLVTLGLAVARARLSLDRTGEQVESVRTLLWELALHLEEGGVPAAERRLQQAREQLAEALRHDAPTEEITRLMEQLKDALDEYLTAVAAEMARRQGDVAPMPPMGDVLRSDDLRALLDQAAALTRSGAREAAQAMLGELQRLLDGIRLGLQQGPAAEKLARAAETIEQMKALKAEQQALLDQTFQRLREQQAERKPGRPGKGNGEKETQRQRALREQLGQLAERLQETLGQIPQALGAADQAMRDALGGMAGNRLDRAVEGQGRAVDALSQALEQASQALAQQMGNGVGLFGYGPGAPGGDPFGRQEPNGRRGFALGTVKIPEEAETLRVQELLRELRRRAGDPDRSGDELRYIERLLRQF